MSAILADLEMRAERISEWERIVRASSILGSEDMADSQEETLDNDKDPSMDLGVDARLNDENDDAMEFARFSSSVDSTAAGFEDVEPILLAKS